MNILIPHSWLLEHLDTTASPADIQRCLSLCGPSVERINQVGTESVYDIEVTTNRVDMMSVRGIAREAAVILPQFGLAAKLKPAVANYVAAARTTTVPLPHFHNNPTLNRRALAVVLRINAAAATPDWMAARLEQIGEQVHTAIIDITNYITHAYGHPCHAFDYDKIMALGGEIRVVEATKGQAFTTLDGRLYSARGGEVVFTNPEGTIIDLPGIMGTANTVVDDHTQRVLFWLESIAPERIRFASMSHAIRTTAATLFEKHLDPSLADSVFAYGIELYEKLAKGKVVSSVLDEYPQPTVPTPIAVTVARIGLYLGLTVDPSRIFTILTDLGCTVSPIDKKGGFTVTPPAWRTDLAIPEDVVEEVARIYGYHNLPSTLMATRLPTEYPVGVDFAREQQAAQLLVGSGLQEVYTYSLVDKATAAQSGQPADRHLAIRNPLSSDNVYLRQTLLPSLAQAFTRLQREKVLGAFELANVYWPAAATAGTSLPDEHLHLAMVATDLRQLRGWVDLLLNTWHIEGVRVEETKINSLYINPFTQSATISTRDGRVLGVLGYLASGYVGCELDWRAILAVASRIPHLQPLPTTAPYREDITVVVNPRVTVGAVAAAIAAAAPSVTRVALVSQYQNKYTFNLQYVDANQQIDATMAAAIHQLVVQAAQQAGAQI